MHPGYKQAHWTALGSHEPHWIHTAYSCFLKPYDFYCNNNLEHFPAQEKDYLSKMPEIQRPKDHLCIFLTNSWHYSATHILHFRQMYIGIIFGNINNFIQRGGLFC